MVIVRRLEPKVMNRDRDPMNPRGPDGRRAILCATSGHKTSNPLHSLDSLSLGLLSSHQDLPWGRNKRSRPSGIGLALQALSSIKHARLWGIPRRSSEWGKAGL